MAARRAPFPPHVSGPHVESGRRNPAGRHELTPGVVLDCRRCVWLAPERTLVVADLHLGYAWAHRAEGNMMPLSAPDDTLARLAALVQDYAPRELVVLGDIVHRAVSLEPVREELRGLCRAAGETATLRLVLGNHDRALERLARECEIAVPMVRQARIGPHLLLHGDLPPAAESDDHEAARTPAPSAAVSPPSISALDHAVAAPNLDTPQPSTPALTTGYTLIGHEHPAIALGDGVSRMKFPCFLTGPRTIIVPAFSPWAAGGEVRSGTFLSPIARDSLFTHAIAILGERLLPVPV